MRVPHADEGVPVHDRQRERSLEHGKDALQSGFGSDAVCAHLTSHGFGHEFRVRGGKQLSHVEAQFGRVGEVPVVR